MSWNEAISHVFSHVLSHHTVPLEAMFNSHIIDCEKLNTSKRLRVPASKKKVFSGQNLMMATVMEEEGPLSYQIAMCYINTVCLGNAGREVAVCDLLRCQFVNFSK